jgi:hypothetical protein
LLRSWVWCLQSGTRIPTFQWKYIPSVFREEGLVRCHTTGNYTCGSLLWCKSQVPYRWCTVTRI